MDGGIKRCYEKEKKKKTKKKKKRKMEKKNATPIFTFQGIHKKMSSAKKIFDLPAWQ